MIAPEFSRPQRLDTIGAGSSRVTIAADDAERAALATRFGWLALDRLEGDFALRRDAAGVLATGRVTGAVVQACVVTGEPLPAAVDERLTLRFVPEGTAASDDVELDEAGCDTMFYSGGAIDLGEAAAETCALALDPFPRSAAAAETLARAGVIGEDEVTPALGALAGLKGLLGG